ncbi:hypothetical protein L7F22_014846 [Adiantum nelumboides]|nr:hypothetical protein [Adiantum nelumboides]
MEDLFEMKEELARGLQGVVRLCTHRNTGHDFACKSFFFDVEPAYPRHRCAAARLALNEVSALAALSTHPNIVSLFAHFEQPSAIHVILELCRGGDLFQHLSQRQTDLKNIAGVHQYANGHTHTQTNHEYSMSQSHNLDQKPEISTCWPLSEFEAAQIFAAALRAVSHCHDHGFMHGDIKLENLLLPREGCCYNDIRLSDFGFAAQFWIANSGRRPVRGMQGTLPYMAPETISSVDDGDANYDEKADIWSLGVLLYLLLCGELPFPGKEAQEVLDAMGILNSSNRWERRIESLIESSLARDMLKRMLHLNPMKRYCANSLLTHPWLQHHGLAGQVPTSRESQQMRECLLQAHLNIRRNMNSNSQQTQHLIQA